ncbi:MAG: Fe-S cluster assembly protein HesB [Candidatus Hodarchaeales archaeon]|jgi:A/G-specific adenine glycosylase
MTQQLTDKKIKDFQKKIFTWWEANKRDFPWRETSDPYKIMVSEFMLQQTQTTRVIDKYLNFINRFPTLEHLTGANPAEIIKLWSGLGYNRRALWLQEAAKMIVSLGFFPQTPEGLKRLKGIGDYTSRSILIFAFNFNLATVDTNIRRILIAEGFALENFSDKELLQVASKLVPIKRSRDWHNALMDYASIIVTASISGIKPKSRQSKFSGSNRQIRGQILKLLIEEESIFINEIKGKINGDEKKIKIIIKSLEKDRLIIISDDNRISLPTKR